MYEHDDVTTETLSAVRESVTAMELPPPPGVERIIARGQTRRHRRSAVLSVVMACSLAVAGAVVLIARTPGHMPQQSATTRPHPRPAASAQWRLVSDVTSGSWTASSLESSGKVVDLECPTTTTCYFVDISGNEPSAGIEVTHDGGQTWQQSSVPGDNSFLGDIGCADADDCMVAGSSSSGQMQFFATSDGGQSWSATSNPDVPATTEPGGVSCPAVGDCIAVGNYELNEDVANSAETEYAMATTDDGQTWTVTQMPSGFVTGSIDCPTADDCIASGYTQQSSDSGGDAPESAIAYSSDGAATWALATLPAGTGTGTQPATSARMIASISCADATDCVAVAGGGKGWVPAGEVLVSSDGGVTWTQAPAAGLPSTLRGQISCPSRTDCWVGGISAPSSANPSEAKAKIPGIQGVLAMTADGGQTFQVSQLPQGAGNGPVIAVSCPSVTTCYALAVNLPQPVNPLGKAGAKSGGGPALKPQTKVFQQKASQFAPATLVLLTYSTSSSG